MPIEYRIGAKGKIIARQADFQAYDDDVVWIDAHSPTDSELAQLDRIMGFEVPNRQDITDIELSSRLYKEDGALVMIASLLPKSDTAIEPPRPAAFVLKDRLLLTIRFYDFFSFDRVAGEVVISNERQDALTIFCRLLEEAVSDRADNLEFSMRHLEELTSRLFIKPLAVGAQVAEVEGPELDEALARIGRMGEGMSNIRESITSLQRVVNFASTYIPYGWLGEQRIVLDALKTDLSALSDEAGFFMNKLSFNLDAVLGMINMEETKVIRLLSIVTLLLAPPTLIAGIYGMNFAIMPELSWSFGYLFALALMLATALLSIWYLRRKRWM